MLTTATTNMKDIYSRLSGLGFSRSFLRQCILPDWWEDSMAAVPANRMLVEAVLSRQLGLDPLSLRDPIAPLRLQPSVEARFKNRHGVGQEHVEVAHTLAIRLAQIAALGYERAALPVEELSAAAIRTRLMDAGAPFINLPSLLDFCWGVGVPVIHLCRKPQSSRQMDGAALRIGGRPVIVIACQRRQPAWQLFILAHELGHVFLGHLLPDDDNIWDNEVRSERQDREERQANSFAVELLTGNPNMKFAPRSAWLTALELAESAASLGDELRIDPGFIALNYAWSLGFIKVGMAALSELEPNADAGAMFREWYTGLDLDGLPEDSRGVFDCLTTPGLHRG